MSARRIEYSREEYYAYLTEMVKKIKELHADAIEEEIVEYLGIEYAIQHGMG